MFESTAGDVFKDSGYLIGWVVQDFYCGNNSPRNVKYPGGPPFHFMSYMACSVATLVLYFLMHDHKPLGLSVDNHG